MKKNPLLLTLAVSALAPNAMAQDVDATSQIANPGFEEGVEGWTASKFAVADKANENYVVGVKFLKLTAEASGKLNGMVTQKIVGLPAGKYIVKANVDTDATPASAGKHYMLAGATEAKIGEIAQDEEVVVGADGVLFIGYKAEDLVASYLGLDNFKLFVSASTIDPIKKELSQKLAIVITKANGVETDDNIQAALTKASAIQVEINAFDFEDYEDYVANGNKSALFTKIEAVEKELVAAVENKRQFDYAMSQYATLADEKAALDAAHKACQESKDYSDEYKKLAKNLYDENVKAYDDLKKAIEASYAAGTAASDFSKDNTDKKIEDLNKVLVEAAKSITSGSNNDLSYAQTVGDVAKAKAAYLEQSQRLYDNLSNEFQPVYGDWFSTASVEMISIAKEIEKVTAENDAAKKDGKCDKESVADFQARLKKVIEDVKAVVNKYVTAADAQKAEYAKGTDAISALETSLAETLKVSKNAATFDSDKAGIKADIDALLATLNEADKAHKIDADYWTKFAESEKKIQDKIATLSQHIGWDNLYLADQKTIADTQKKLTDAIAAVDKLQSKDKLYSAADKYPAAEKAIQDNITKWDETSDKAYEKGKEYKFTFDPTTASVENAITTYSNQAKDVMAHYDEVSDALAKYVAAVDGLKKAVTNVDVTTDGLVNTAEQSYKAYIAACDKNIADAKKAMADAVAAEEAKHPAAVNALTPISEAAVNAVKAETADYEANSKAWNAGQLAAAKERMLKECNTCLEAVKLPASYDHDTYGDKYTSLNTELDSITTVKNKIAANIEAAKAKADEEAIALLTVILTEAEALEKGAAALAEKAGEAKTKYTAEKDANEALAKDVAALKVQIDGDGKTGDEHKIKSIAELNTDDAKDAYFADKEEAIETKIAKLVDAIAKSFDAETLVAERSIIKGTGEDGKEIALDGYDKQIDNLEAEVSALREEAKAASDNLDAKNAMNKHYAEVETKGIIKLIADANTAMEAVYTELAKTPGYAWSESEYYFDGVVKAMNEKAKWISDSIAHAYDWNNAVAKKEGLMSEINILAKKAQGLKAEVEANENAYKAQTDSVEKVLENWNATYAEIIAQAELGNTLKESLDILAKVKVELQNGQKTIAESHQNGISTSKTDSLLLAFGKSNNEIDAVRNGWGDAYKAEVAAYNLKTKNAFDDQYYALSQAYANAVQLVDKMNKTEWASEEDVKAELDLITKKDGGLYSYAEKIRAIKAEAQAAYDKAVAPIVFEEGEAFINEAKAMQADVERLYNEYSDKVNALARADYQDTYDKAEDVLTEAMNEVTSKLFGTANYPKSGAFTPIKKDLDDAKYTAEEDSTFALQYDNVLKTLNGIEARIPGAKEADAKNHYNSQFESKNELAATEAAEIAQFHGKDGKLGAFSGAYAEYVKISLTAAQSRYDNLKEYYKEMTEASVMNGDKSEETLKTLLAKFALVDRVVGKDKEGKDIIVSHSAKYWEASDENDAWNVNDESYVYMNLQVDTVIGKLDTLDMFRLPLVATNAVQKTIDDHAADIAEVQATIEEAHKAVTSKDVMATVDAELKAIASEIEASYRDVLISEYSAIQSQLVALRLEYSLAEAVEIDSIDVQKTFEEVIDGYEAEANLIHRDYTEGRETVDKDGKPVKMTDDKGNVLYISKDSAQVAYLNLEEKIGLTRQALAEIYNETLYKQIYDDLFVGVDSVQAQIDEQALFNGCHPIVKAKFEDEVKALDETLAGIVAAINARNEANTLMVYAENLTADIQEVADNIAALAKEIAAEEALYDLHDENYERLNAELDKLDAEVDQLSATLHAYEYLTYEDNEAILDQLNADVLELKDSIVSDRKILVEANEKADIEKGEYLTSTDKNKDAEFIVSRMNSMLLGYSLNNVHGITLNRYNAYVNAEYKLGHNRYTDEDFEVLAAEASVIYQTIMNINNYYRNAWNYGEVSKDINGNKYFDEDGNETTKTIKFMDAYAEAIEALNVLTPKLNEWVKNVDDLKYELGDVDHNKLVNVNDYITVRNMVLGIITNETEGINSAAFYAADVNEDGKIDITDLTQVANNIMTGKSFGSYAARSLATANQNNSDAISAVVNGTGRHQQLVISLNNEMNYVGAQMDIVLPAGVKVVGESLADRAATHELFSNDVNGAHRVVISDIDNNEFQNNEQALLVIDLEVSADFEGGALEINDAIFTTANGRGYALKAAIGGGETGITNLTVTEKAASRVYSIGGQMMNTLRKGINIIVNSDGTAKKVVNK